MGPFSFRQIAAVLAAAALPAVFLFVVTQPLGRPPGASPNPRSSFYLIGPEAEGLQIGQQAPDFAGMYGGETVELTNLDGDPIRLADYAGRPVWIVFWATWCPPCQQETPDIRAAYDDHEADGLVVVAIDVQEPVDIVREYASKYGLGYSIGLDTYGVAFERYGVFGLPTHYFIDRQGVIRDRYFGPLTRQQMEDRIAAISGP